MTTSDDTFSTGTHLEKLWHFISLAQFEEKRPQEPAQEAVRHGLRTLWERLPFNHSTPDESEIPEEARSLKSAPLNLVDMAVPDPQWDGLGGAGLDEALGAWLEQGAEAGARSIVVGPASGVDQMVRAWGQEHAIPILASPGPEEILAGGDWLDQALLKSQAGDSPQVILPDLARWYLRHPDGLDLVRRLLDRLWEGKVACLVVCDSWAWAFLDRVLHVDSVLPGPLALDPFDAADLSTWFRALAERRQRHAMTFRQVNNGQPVLAPAPQSAPDDEQPNGLPKLDLEFLTHLAARSRGNPGVARAIWRECLQISSTEEVDPKAQEEAEADRGYTMWVNPWSKLRLPGLPGGAGRAETFVLHTLLLHNGLPASVLPRLLPLDRGEVTHILHRLRTARLVMDVEDRWYVTPLGYPMVRSFLSREGVLTDVL